jgi:beta-galactosidase/beta-glucuronidase
MIKKNVVSYHPGHPNPQFYRPIFASLNGTWQFIFDDEQKGLTEGWSNKIPDKTRPIQVPYAYETPLSGINEQEEHDTVWYFKTFANPHWSEKVMLHFERLDYVFDGWLNGHYLGKHIGGYDAFARDISEYLNDGDNLLSIRVYDDKDPSHVRGKQTWKKDPFECFYETTTGIYGDVWLEQVPYASLQGCDLRGLHEDKSVYARLLFTPEAVGEEVTIKISYHGEDVTQMSLVPVNIFWEGEIAIPAKAFHSWSPAHPCLYDVDIVLKRNGNLTDEVLTYFGINEVSTRDRRVLLNGKKRYLKFVLYQGYNPAGGLTSNEEGYLKDISLIKAMGFNGLRIHEKIETELFYYLCDREGLLSDVEMPSPQSYNHFENFQIQSEFGRIITDHVAHPSIIAYVAYNESWGIQGISRDSEQVDHLNSLYQMANRIDWTRPVISNDGWEATETDIVAVHNYAQDGKALLAAYSGMKPALAQGGNFEAIPGKYAFAAGYHYSGQPVLLSEFFGAAFKSKDKKSWGYNSPITNPRIYVRRYRSLLRAIKKLSFAGYCVTQFADTYQETNGFVTDEREPKAPLESIKRANQSF